MGFMKDSKLDENWLRQVMASNPPSVGTDAQGKPLILSGPVRLAFVNINEKGNSQRRNDGSIGEGKYGATLLFPVGTNLVPLKTAWREKMMTAFSSSFDAATGKFYGLEDPFHDQAAKAFGPKTYSGFTPGAEFFNSSTRYKPSVVDGAMNTITDPERIYAGAWAIVALNTYVYGVNPPQPKKGVGFGLQTVMLIADDTKLVGGGPDPKTAFGGVQISGGLDVSAQFGGAMPGSGVGTAGTLPVQPIDAEAAALAALYGD